MRKNNNNVKGTAQLMTKTMRWQYDSATQYIQFQGLDKERRNLSRSLISHLDCAMR